MRLERRTEPACKNIPLANAALYFAMFALILVSAAASSSAIRTELIEPSLNSFF